MKLKQKRQRRQRQPSSKWQLEKSIVSHDQGETRKPSQKQHRHKTQPKKKRQLNNDNRRNHAHKFDAFEADYVDFGAVIGQNGAFSWHANYSPD